MRKEPKMPGKEARNISQRSWDFLAPSVMAGSSRAWSTRSKVIAAHDVGKVLNPTLLAGQVEGAVHMGLGHSLSEEFVVDNGVPVTTTLKSLNIIPDRKS